MAHNANSRPVVVCGPSGSGISTLIRALIKTYPDVFHYCASYTTRPKRSNEVNGRDYYFISKELFEKMLREDQFIEHENFAGYYYGTSKAELDKAVSDSKTCLLDTDIRGMEKLRKTAYNPICIFIRPRNMAILEKRLRSQSMESEDRILQRLAVANQELQIGLSDGKFDATIVNDDLDRSIQEILEVLHRIDSKE